MRIAQKLGLAAMVLFAISQFLPAYGSGRGFACFQVCWETLVKPDTHDLGAWLYYSGFVISSILFLVLVVALFMTEKIRQPRGLGSFILFLHVMSWSFLHVIDGNRSGFYEIKVGYYVWLLAYALLFVAHVVKEPNRLGQQTKSVTV